ncbi:hypothetical protein EDE05_102104 [Neorhizobium sp. R1-B]|nr:hypothetical protein EDE05_102104 [Neorhizobium sp. R1-B]
MRFRLAAVVCQSWSTAPACAFPCVVAVLFKRFSRVAQDCVKIATIESATAVRLGKPHLIFEYPLFTVFLPLCIFCGVLGNLLQ